MMMNHRLVSLLACVLPALAPAARAADPAVEAAGKIQQQYAAAVVSLEGVLSISAEGQLASLMGGDREQKVSAVGTVIDPSGLTVASLAGLNPVGESRKINVNVGGQAMSATLKGELSELRIRLADGTEIPARLVLKDEDLDLAFLAPREALDEAARKQLRAVDLGRAAEQARPLTRTVQLGRLGKDLNREPTVRMTRIAAVITKPRTFYFLGTGQPGTPVFTMDGRLLGVNVVRQRPSGRRAAGRTVAIAVGGATVALPAKDVRRIAEQAREELAAPTKAPAGKQKQP